MSYSASKKHTIGTEGAENEYIYEITPDAATGDVTFSDFTKVAVVGAPWLAEDYADTAQLAMQALEDSTTLNKVNFKLWKDGAASDLFKKFRIRLRTCVGGEEI